MLLAADRAVEVTSRSLLGQVGSLGIGFFLWGAGGFFARIIRDYRKLHPDVRLSLCEMRTPEQMEALTSGRIDVAFARPLEPPFDRMLRSEPLYRDPIVIVLPRDHPMAVSMFRSMRWWLRGLSSAIDR
jgi:DNA-binding transcriptional LysR family regulator